MPLHMHSTASRGRMDSEEISASPEPIENGVQAAHRGRRAAHSKSRSGCLRCKKRRVKCNEARPKCRACELRGETCRYPATKACSSCSRLACVCFDSSVPGPSSPDDWADFECTFHYARYTYDTIINEPLHLKAKPLLKPPECLRHPFLMDLLLGLSAAHLAVLKPAEIEDYGLRAVNYQNRALSGFYLVLQDPHPDHDSLLAMFVFSAFLGILEVAISRTAGAQQKQSFVETMCALTRLFRGSQMIMKKAREAMSDETWNSIFRDEDSKLRLRHLTIDHDDFAMPGGEPLDEMLSEIDSYLPVQADSHDPTGQDGHPAHGREQAVRYLRRLTAIQVPDGRASQLLSWPAMWTDAFMRDVQEGEPRSEAVLACYGLTLRHLNDRWWAKDFGRDVVLEVASGSSSTVLGPFYAQMVQMIESSSG